MAETAMLERIVIVRHGRRLEYFTIAWNTFEGLVAVIAGAVAGSISLVGFGIDSFIEVTSGSVLLWRMSVDADVHRRETNEKRALRIVGACLGTGVPVPRSTTFVRVGRSFGVWLFGSCGLAPIANKIRKDSNTERVSFTESSIR
jgi:hypothetical protein